ncbi:MAG: DnaJ domain-containing protein [Methylomicrobium sp.]
MDASLFTDYYETLEISPNANTETIDRIFRYLAQRYHPDNQDTGDHKRFSEIVRAHDTLRDPVKRAKYDIQHKNHGVLRSRLAEEASDHRNIERDVEIQEKLLSILYMKRRRDIHNPGIGNLDLERLSDCPHEHLEFHLWYLKEKGWICRLENGMLAITAEGIDRANAETKRESDIKLLTDQFH